VLAQIDRQVEPVRPELLGQFRVVILGQFALTQLRPSMEERERNGRVDRGTTVRQSFRGLV
jgi:hypothetical protein